MITPLLQSALDPVVQRHRRLRFHTHLAWCWLAAGAVALVLWWGKVHVPFAALLVGLGAGLVAWLTSRRARAWEPDYRSIAAAIEARHPELHALLCTAVEQTPDQRTGQLHYLQQRVIADAVRESRKQRWVDAIPAWRMAGTRALQWLALLALISAVGLLGREELRTTQVTARSADAVTVTPGDASLERGSGLIVLAKFHRAVPSEAVLVLEPVNQAAQRIPLVKNLDDPVFGGGLPEVDADLSYHVEYAGQRTRSFSVRVFEHPRLERADATLQFPEYTKQPEKKIPDTRRVSAVEGTKLAIEFRLNKPVQSATLISKDGTQVPLAIEPGQPLAALREFPVRASQAYELRLEDTDGRANKVPAQFIVEALPNRRPELKIATPKGDQRVSPIEEVAFRADAWDDFGMLRYGLTYTVAGRPAQDVELGHETQADERQSFAHLLKLEELGAKPDELISWFLWAEDAGPDGKTRRTATDMYFAEVRPFEEIFRQGAEQEGGQQSGQASEAEKAADSQKQIISATWNLKRAEEATGSPKPSAKYLKDEPVVRDAQRDALAKATALAGRVEDPKSKALIENVTREMQSALDRLTEAAQSTAPLPDALTAEQAAYNALLKLAAHEFRVTRQKGSSGGQANNRNQQQLDQLELKEEKQRYETKREAEPMQNEQQREQLAVLNRLKELAQRQNDVNERVKELQTALQEAKTEKEKEEIRRQLKRLREEEQQLVADLDELRQKMEQSPQQAQLADERKQLDQIRAEAQQASESMERNAASQALASGTRAARDLQQMRDEYRKKTSQQFTDEMREMRADARGLAQRQQELAEKLKPEPGKPQRRTLDGSSEREKLGEEFQKQQGALGNLTESMKRVSEQAEGAEPLLAKELYDALRKTTQAGTGETLEKTQILAERGFTPQAQKFEQKARQEIEELKTGVERAAESVLGDEAEALRQARAELDALTQQLNREIAQARPDLAGDDGQRAGDRGQNGTPPGSAGVSPTGREKGEEAGGQNSRAGEGNPPSQRSEDAAGRSPSERSREAGSPESPGNGQPRPGQQPGQGGQKPGEQPGQTAGAGQQGQPGENPQSESQPGGEQGAQAGQQGQQGGQGGEGQQGRQGQQGGRSGSSTQPGQVGQVGQQQASSPGQGGQRGGAAAGENPSAQEPSANQNPGATGARPGSRLGELPRAPRERGGIRTGAAEGGGMWGGGTEGEQAGPLTGGSFVEWSDRLRNVEEMLDDPALRTEAARVREVAKGVRAEFKRHSVPPNWDMVQTRIRTPLAELRNRVTEELARRESKESLVPIDRDPVPTKYAERVRRYYEDLGRSK